MERDEVAVLAQRAALGLSPQELEELQAADARIQAQLQALRARLEQAEEPALTFQTGAR